MTSLLRTPLTAIEQMILRNVISGDRLNGITLANQQEHDAAVMSLIRRGLINYNRHRPRQKFIVTTAGRQQLAAATKQNEVRRGAVPPQATVASASPKDRDTAGHVAAAGNDSAPADLTVANLKEAAKRLRDEPIAPIVQAVHPQDEWAFQWGRRRKFREIDGRLIEVDPNEPDPPPSGASLRVTAIDVANGVITLGDGE